VSCKTGSGEASAHFRSNGDTSGFSYHADWLNGWPSGLLVDAFKNCELNGYVDGCQLLENSKDVDKANNCLAEGTVVNEVRISLLFRP
jgi:hypothetical protein